MLIYQMHEKHGKHIAYSTNEAEANKKNGWKTVTEEVFNAKKTPPKSVPAVEANVVAETSQETPTEVNAEPKKRGRKRLNGNGA